MADSPISPERISKLTEMITGWLDNQLSSKTLVQSILNIMNKSDDGMFALLVKRKTTLWFF